jgi:hypothetical protein
MSQQVQARSLLVLGDSNVRRYLYRAGGAYSETCDCGVVRNLSEFGSSLKMVENHKYRIIIFSMLTNILIDAGSEGTDHASRMNAIEECLSPLLENLRYDYFSQSSLQYFRVVSGKYILWRFSHVSIVDYVLFQRYL